MVFMVSSWDNQKMPVKAIKQENKVSKGEDKEDLLEIEKIMRARSPCKNCND